MQSIQNQMRAWPIDVKIFLALFAGFAFLYHESPPFVSLLFVLLLVYILADRLTAPRVQRLVKFTVLALLLGYFAVGLMTMGILLRHQSAPSAFVHDGAIQIEESVKFLLAGKNPYVEDYTQTSLSNWKFQVGDITVNPALYHNAYLPFMFVAQIPFFILAQAALGWFDARMVFLLAFLGFLLIALRWVGEASRRYALILLIVLNPFFITFLVEGRNDIFVLFWIVLAIELLRQKRNAWSAVALGLACASKLTAWFLIPFWILYLLQPSLNRWQAWLSANRSKILDGVLPLGATIAIFILPFLLWNPGAFIDDVWLYPNGTSAVAPYPVYGYGLNIILQALGVLPASAVRSPFEILQWVFGLPLLVWLVWYQLTHNTLAQMWFGYALLIGVMGFFSHVLNDNHIGLVLVLFAIAFLGDEPTMPASAKP